MNFFSVKGQQRLYNVAYEEKDLVPLSDEDAEAVYAEASRKWIRRIDKDKA